MCTRYGVVRAGEAAFLYLVQLQHLEQTERWIDTELTLLRERAARRPLPEGPALILSYLREGGRAVADSIHLGGCRMAAKHT
ncbi:hypothetical protein OG361_38615 [Streptomyces sp. NBC_00090]|uniref:hypothetical protein n=1 Tax=Streptomyces sp. NBC_00090 TaxID=2903619 RepID=UPI003249210D